MKAGLEKKKKSHQFLQTAQKSGYSYETSSPDQPEGGQRGETVSGKMRGGAGWGAGPQSKCEENLGMSTLMCTGQHSFSRSLVKHLAHAYSDECCRIAGNKTSYSLSLIEIITLFKKYASR